MKRTYQFQIIKASTNKSVFKSKKYKDVEKMEEESVNKSCAYDETYYCIQYWSENEDGIDFELTRWIYNKKLNCGSSDTAQQKMTDKMCDYENKAFAEVFVC